MTITKGGGVARLDHEPVVELPQEGVDVSGVADMVVVHVAAEAVALDVVEGLGEAATVVAWQAWLTGGETHAGEDLAAVRAIEARLVGVDPKSALIDDGGGITDKRGGDMSSGEGYVVGVAGVVESETPCESI